MLFTYNVNSIIRIIRSVKLFCDEPCVTAGWLVGWNERMGIHGRPETRMRRTTDDRRTRTTSLPTIPILAPDSPRERLKSCRKWLLLGGSWLLLLCIWAVLR